MSADGGSAAGGSEAIGAIEVRPSAAVTATLIAMAVVVVSTWVVIGYAAPLLACFGLPVLVGCSQAMLLIFRLSPVTTRVPVTLRVDEGTLTIEDQVGHRVARIPRARISAALKAPTGDGLRLRLRRAWRRDVELAVVDEATADELVSRLGHDVDQAKVTFVGMSRIHTPGPGSVGKVLAVLLAGLAVAGISAAIHPALMLLTLPTFVVVALLAAAWPAPTEVGSDGVVLRWLGWLGTTRFIAHRDITDVRAGTCGNAAARRRAVILTLRSGETVEIPTATPTWDDGKAEFLAERIRDAGQIAAGNDDLPSLLLTRSERSFAEWVQALRAYDVTGFRGPAVSRARLWRVIEDAAASALERAAAMVALGPELPRDERERLARISKAVAAPKLRVALETGPDAEMPKLADLLEDLEEESVRAEKKREKK